MSHDRLIPLALMAIVVGCETDVAQSGDGGRLDLAVVVAGDISTSVDVGRITLLGPTDTTVETSPGSQVTISALIPGSYTVILEGLTGGEVELYGEKAGITVNAGATTPVTVLLDSFLPNLGPLPAMVEAGLDVVVRFSRVAGATGYTVEWADNPVFDAPQSTQTSDTTATIHPDPGTVYIRVRASDRLGSIGRASSTASVEIPATGTSMEQKLLAAGQYHSCALDSGGQAWCWGDNSQGQLGDDTYETALEPVAVAGGHDFVSLTVGQTGSHTCALDPNGVAYCWGDNDSGQLGDGTTDSQGLPEPVAGGLTFKSLSAGVNHTCGVTVSGQAWCWGLNSLGALGDGTTINHVVPAPVASSEKFTRIAAGFAHTCAVTEAGDVYCWGRNTTGQLGDGQSGSPQLSPVPVAGVPPLVGIAASAFHSCGWTAQGTAYCWGRGLYGRLGDGDPADEPRTPRQVLNVTDFVEITAANGFTCGLTSNHLAYCWGLDRSGRLGTGGSGNESVPTQISGLSGVVAVAGGGVHGCAIVSSGQALCWGYWSLGALGNGTTALQPEPVEVAGGPAAFGSLATGSQFACATSSGTPAGPAFCWGLDDTGQLGDGGTASQSSPTPVSGGLSFAGLSAGRSHVCGLDAAGTILCWGDGSFGQLGTGSNAGSNVPVMVTGTPPAASVVAGGDHSCALIPRYPAQIRCWGENARGQVGNGTTIDQMSPATVIGLPEVAAVAAGSEHTCAVATDLRAFCWGRNEEGELGDTTTIDRSLPVQVLGLPPVTTITAGDFHTCALTAGGSAYCWGLGDDGQLGDGSFNSSAFPRAVAGGISFVSISAGESRTCAVATDQRAFCWGNNANGELGTGNFDSQGSPVEVTGNLRFVTGPDGVRGGGGVTCGITTNGRVWCWGLRDYGTLGDGVFPVELAPVAVAGSIVFRTQ